MKKIISLSLVLMLLLGILAVSAIAEETTLVGALSYLNMSEDDEGTLGLAFRRVPVKILALHGVLTGDSETQPSDHLTYQHYDSLNAMLLGLDSGEVKAISVPYYTAKYLCSTNSKVKLKREYHPENAKGLSDWALARLCDGYSFMLKEENTALRDEFDAQIKAMKEDGTLQKLVDEYIIKASEGGEAVAVSFEQFEGDPMKVGVTGDLPPMDYVAPDGRFAGFNTAVLAEIGKRMQRNIELVQVDSIGRALALSEGVVDVVFWTRGLSEEMVEERVANRGLSDEERAAKRAERLEAMTEEEKAIFGAAGEPTDDLFAKLKDRDLPAGTIITRPYFSDFPVLVTLKEAE